MKNCHTEQLRQPDKEMQRSWGGNDLGMFKNQKKLVGKEKSG